MSDTPGSWEDILAEIQRIHDIVVTAAASAEESAGIASEKATEAYNSAGSVGDIVNTAVQTREAAENAMRAANKSADAAARSAEAIASAEGQVSGAVTAMGELIRSVEENAESAAHSAEQAGETPALLAAFAVNIGNMEGSILDQNTAIQNQTNTLTAALQVQDGAIAEAIRNQTDAIDDVEDLVDDCHDQVDLAVTQVQALRTEFERAEVLLINSPNLLKQNYFEKYIEPTTEMAEIQYTIPAETAAEAALPITFTASDPLITAESDLYYVDYYDGDDTAIDWDQNHYSCTVSAGSASITIPARTGAHNEAVTIQIGICESELQTIIYGQTSRHGASDKPYLKNVLRGSGTNGTDPDTITAQVVEFSDADAIVDQDNEVYRHALEFTVASANSAYGNVEELIFNHGNYGAGTVTETGPREYGNIAELTPGQKYTMSCWARVTDGAKILVKFAWDPIKNYSTSDENKCSWQEIEGSVWRRYSWTFIFNPTGNQFTNTTANGTTTRAANWTKTVSFGISRKYAGTVQMCGFRLTAGNLRKNTSYEDLQEVISALTDRVTALEAMALENE